MNQIDFLVQKGKNKKVKLISMMVKLLFFGILPAVYAEIHIPLTDTIEITVKNAILSIDDELEIETVVYHSSDKNNGYFVPVRFMLEENDEYSECIKSTRNADEERTILNTVYTMKKTGTLTFSSAFVDIGIDKKIIPPFTVTVHAPPLSENTEFSWRISSLNGKTYLNEPPVQGESYLLFLTADFFFPDELTDNDVTADKTVSDKPNTDMQNAENFNHSKTNPDRFLQQLPPELRSIECPAPENAAVDPFHPDRSFSYPNSALQHTGGQQHTSGQPQIDQTQEISEPPHHILAVFTWTPFFDGEQPLPEAKIQFASGKTVFTEPDVRIIQQKEKTTVKKTATAEKKHPAFSKPKPVVQQRSGSENTAELTAVARKIADYRAKELHAIFSAELRIERKKLEASLNLSEVQPLYPLILWRSAGVATLVCSLFLLIFLRLKKMLLSIIFSGAVLGCGITAFNLYRDAVQPKGICIIGGEESALRHIPERTGSSIRQLAIGEGVAIETETPEWYFVKTQNGVSGWIPQTAVAVYTKPQE